MLIGILAAALLLAGGPDTTVAGPPSGYVTPGKGDKCPVCGMFVAKYPDWAAQVRFTDGAREVFDGVKDLFRYLAGMGRYGGTHKRGEVAAVFATDYYSLEPVDGVAAFYVAGSDVYGPMGKELIPFALRAEAEGFLRDHRGSRIVGFEEALREIESLVE